MSDNPREKRLPPPAFPPGQRRHIHRNSAPSGNHVEPDDEVGLISPDDPMPLRRDPIEQAFISPDDPIPERRIELTPEFAEFARPTPADGEGEVVSMDLDAHTDPIDVVSSGDPHVMELVDAIAKLAEALKRKGEAGLRTKPHMTRFEHTLRAYCVGYLAGRRAEGPPPPPPEDIDY
jgi:hypothetical protein